MAGENFPKLVELMARLRGPGGCPWDREQTFDSIKPFLLEETYEVLDAIAERDWDELTGELGDLLLQVVFFARMAEEEGRFRIEDVIERIHAKMVARHPHVFADGDAATAADVLKKWELLKAEEKKKRLAERGEQYQPPESVLDGVSARIPSLMEAYQLSSRAAHVGFDWPSLGGIVDKVHEELGELQAEAQRKLPPPDATPPSSEQQELQARIEAEVGDLLFTVVNAARFLKVDPESALRTTNRKFRHRFQWLERELKSRGRTPRESNLEEMDALWNQAKQIIEGPR
jgi:MazG family protein